MSFKLILVNLNFFADKHGKNARDSHFSCLSRFIKDESLIRQLKNIPDVVEAINNRQRASNENRILRSNF